MFFIDLLLKQGNYTDAFSKFSQTLERLLYLRYHSEDWLKKGYIEIENYKGSRDTFNPGFQKLISAWFKTRNQPQDSVYKLFDSIRKCRNNIVHEAVPISQKDLISLWNNAGWTLDVADYPETAIKTRWVETMQMVCSRDWRISEQTLVESLYRWGLEVLEAELASSQV